MLRFIIKERYVRMFEIINKDKPNMLKLARLTGFHYPHVINVLKQFQCEEIIEPIFGEGTKTENDGYPKKIVTLSKKGQALRGLMGLMIDLHVGKNPKHILKMINELNKQQEKNENNNKQKIQIAEESF